MKRRFTDVIQNLIIWMAGALFLLPFLWMIASSLKSQGEIFGSPLGLLPSKLHLENYGNLFASFPFGAWYRNSLIITTVVTALTLLFSSLAGFGFGKYRFRAKSLLFAVVFASMSLPFQSILIPLYSEMAKLHLINTYLSLVLPFVAPPIGIFLMRQFMDSIPDELMYAARIDGCSEAALYVRIILPLLRPAIGALAIITFVFTWSNFVWPLVMLNDNAKFTLPLGLYTLDSNVSNGGTVRYGEIFAGATMASLPPIVLFFLMQRSFASGLTVGGVKG